jgi:tetratricopeptide (TPR) repeat protein
MELQMKGDDVFMGSFSMLKSFPFFNEPVNWFIPFFHENPEITEIIELNEQTIRQLVKTIEMAPVLCNSDKYSLCLSIHRLPAENIGVIMQAMQAEMEQIKELTEDEKLIKPERIPEFVSNQYIQDLYRFYKLFPRKADFEDIFNWRLDFHHKQVFAGIFNEDPGMQRNIAEYYFAREYFEEAAGIFTTLLDKEKSEELYQKIAWCKQKTGDFNSALDSYLKAELIGTHNAWTLKKIALCYRNLRKPDKALEYYYAAEKADPENLGIQLNIGHCLLELNQYKEALKSYFKVEYLSPGNKKVWRPLGWCSFITGNKEQAEKYFLKLMADEPNKHDFISMGHVQWSLGKRRPALDYYQKSISQNGFSEAEFLQIFEEDLPHLLGHGIDKDDIPIMLDQLRYYLVK